MNTWRDNRGAPASRNRGPLKVNDSRDECPWVIGEVHHLTPDYIRMRRVHEPVARPSRWPVAVAFAITVLILGAAFNA